MAIVAVLGGSYLIWLTFFNKKQSKSTTINDIYAKVKTENKPAEKPVQIEKLSTTGQLNAQVFFLKTRTFGMRHLEPIEGKDYGIPKNYLGNMVLQVYQDIDGTINPLPGSTYTILEHSPGEIYRAVNTKERVHILWGRVNPLDKVKLWLIILGVGVALFIGWMAVAGKGHG